MAAVDTTQTRTAAARRYDVRVGAACALAGAALFSLLIWRMGFGYGGAWDPRAAWVLTPVFLAPLLICLVRAGRLGIGGAIALTLALTVVHFNAITVVAFGYKQQTDDSLWHMLDKSQAYWTAANAKHAAQRVIAEHSALVGGRKAGAIGAFVSFALLLPFGRGFRRPSSLAAMLVAGVPDLLGRLRPDPDPAGGHDSGRLRPVAVPALARLVRPGAGLGLRRAGREAFRLNQRQGRNKSSPRGFGQARP